MVSKKTNVYVDGFNLYYGCLKGTPYRWLDVGKLCELLLPDDDIGEIKYFAALVSTRPGDPGIPRRQQTYFRALRTIPNLSIHLGHYLTHRARMMLAKPTKGGPNYAWVIKTEEKGSDVNLATAMLVDAYEEFCSAAVVISNDSDLKTPIEVVKDRLDLPVGVINPHPGKRRSRVLKPTFFKQIRKGVLEASQFPRELVDGQGRFHKPESW